MKSGTPSNPLPPPSSLLASLLAAALLAGLVMGCAPSRSADDDDDDGGGIRFERAMFTVVDEGPFTDYLTARLVLVDAALDCSDLGWGGTIPWWSLPTSVQWVEAFLLLGRDLATWDREFQSYYSWQLEGTFEYRNAAYFSGNIGVGDLSSGDDDDDDDQPEPPPIGRDVTGALGMEEDQTSDRLVVQNYSTETGVRGFIQSTEEDYDFDAEHCDIFEDVPIGGQPTPGDEPASEDSVESD